MAVENTSPSGNTGIAFAHCKASICSLAGTRIETRTRPTQTKLDSLVHRDLVHLQAVDREGLGRRQLLHAYLAFEVLHTRVQKKPVGGYWAWAPHVQDEKERSLLPTLFFWCVISVCSSCREPRNSRSPLRAPGASIIRPIPLSAHLELPIAIETEYQRLFFLLLALSHHSALATSPQRRALGEKTFGGTPTRIKTTKMQ